MKKRRIKLMALMTAMCVCTTSMPSVLAANTDSELEEVTGFQQEMLEEDKEALSEQEDFAEETDNNVQKETEDVDSDDLMEDTISEVSLWTDAVWQDVTGEEAVPADTVNKRLYKKENGSVTDQYYTSADGMIQVKVNSYETYTYLFDDDGFIVTGQKEYDGKEYFFIPKSMVTENSTDSCPQTGRMQKDYWYLTAKEDGNAWNFYGADGALTEAPDISKDIYVADTDVVWEDVTLEGGTVVSRLFWKNSGEQTQRYFTDLDGLVTVQDGAEIFTYGFDEEGKRKEGLQTIGEKEYYFTTEAESGGIEAKTGAMVMDEWVLLNDGKVWGYFGTDGVREEKSEYVEINSAHYYLDKDGEILTGIIYVDGVNRYFDPSTTPMGQEGTFTGATGWIKVGEAWKYVNADGSEEIRTGIQKVQSGTYNEWLCLDSKGVPMKNVMEKHTNGLYYYFGADGTRTDKKFVTIDGKKYYFGTYGARATWKNVWKTINNRKYYFNSKSYVENEPGWHKIGNYWYYFSAAGNMQHDRWITQSGKKYYVNENGVMYGGLRKIDGYYYYFKWSQGNTRYGYALTSRWVKTKGYWYYANSSGRMQKGWITVGGKQYYLDSNCRLVTNKWVTNNSGVRGYLDSDGVFQKGNTWVNVGGHWRYLKDGAKNGWATGWTRIDGYKYYFESNGDMRTDLTNMPGFTTGPYMFDVNRTTCTVTVLAKDENGNFKVPIIAFVCSVGLPSTPTPTGTYWTTRALRWQPLMGPSWGQYGTHVDGAGAGGIYFHSVAGSAPNSYSISAGNYNLLGQPASHGCIRLTVRDAKWIWDHAYSGNKAYIHDSASNIFYKPSAPKIGAGTTYDPTDPAI